MSKWMRTPFQFSQANTEPKSRQNHRRGFSEGKEKFRSMERREKERRVVAREDGELRISPSRRRNVNGFHRGKHVNHSDPPPPLSPSSPARAHAPIDIALGICCGNLSRVGFVNEIRALRFAVLQIICLCITLVSTRSFESEFRWNLGESLPKTEAARLRR